MFHRHDREKSHMKRGGKGQSLEYISDSAAMGKSGAGAGAARMPVPATPEDTCVAINDGRGEVDTVPLLSDSSRFDGEYDIPPETLRQKLARVPEALPRGAARVPPADAVQRPRGAARARRPVPAQHRAQPEVQRVVVPPDAALRAVQVLLQHVLSCHSSHTVYSYPQSRFVTDWLDS